VALALHIAGASVETIAADYALTDDSSPDIITNTFTHLHIKYGSVAKYLIGSGVAPTDLVALRSRLNGEHPDAALKVRRGPT